MVTIIDTIASRTQEPAPELIRRRNCERPSEVYPPPVEKLERNAMSPAPSGIEEQQFTLLDVPKGSLSNMLNILFIRLWRNPGRSVQRGCHSCQGSRTEGHLERDGSRILGDALAERV